MAGWLVEGFSVKRAAVRPAHHERKLGVAFSPELVEEVSGVGYDGSPVVAHAPAKIHLWREGLCADCRGRGLGEPYLDLCPVCARIGGPGVSQIVRRRCLGVPPPALVPIRWASIPVQKRGLCGRSQRSP